MKSLLIDIGATRVKYSIFFHGTDSFLGSIKSENFPLPNIKDNGKNETNLSEISLIFENIVKESSSNFQISNVFICCQMHGFILQDNNKELITNFISWKDERASNRYREAEQMNFFDSFSEKIPDFKDITGIKIRSGLPAINLYSMVEDSELPENIKVLNLAEYLIESLTEKCSGSHRSLSESLGFHNFETNLIDKKINNLFSKKLIFKNSYNHVEIVSDWIYENKKINFFTPFGDMQCAIKGLNISFDKSIVINMGTGSQIVTQVDSIEKNNFEKRSYFNNEFLDVFTHFPCGRALSIYVDLLNSESSINYWDELNKLNIKDILSSNPVNLSIFKSADNYAKLKNEDFLNKSYSENILLLNGLMKSLVLQYDFAIKEALLHMDINKIFLAGGVAHKLDFIEDLFENYYSIKTEKIYRDDETLLGIKNIIKDTVLS